MEKKIFNTYHYGIVTVTSTGDTDQFGNKEFEMTAEDGGDYGYIYHKSINDITEDDIAQQIDENLFG